MVRKIADPVFSVYTAANFQGLTKILFLYTLCVIFFSAEDLIQLVFQQLERTKFFCHPAPQVIIFKIHVCTVCGAMESLLLSEASGHYSIKRATPQSGEFVIKV